MSAARAFLRPAMKRKNVRVETNALATRILFEGTRAIGVEYEHSGANSGVRPRREVILSRRLDQFAAASAAFRRRPGRATCSGLGIDIVHANENVGRNLQDHVGINYTFKGREPTLNQILRPMVGQASGSACNMSSCARARCRCR